MRARVGHARPVGTTWRMRLRWEGDGDPELGDLVSESPVELHRGYRVVGVEEGRDRTRWVVVMERMKWGEFLVELDKPDARYWTFVRDRR